MPKLTPEQIANNRALMVEGENWPIFRTEEELNALRAKARGEPSAGANS